MEKGLQLLRNAGAVNEREAATKRDLDAALADMAEAHADYEEYKIKRAEADRAGRSLVAKLQRARAKCPEAAARTLDLDGMIEKASRKRDYAVSIDKDEIRGLSGRHPADVAAELALKLLRAHSAPSRRKGREEIGVWLPATTRTGVVCRLAAILYGDPGANLFARVQKVAKKQREQIRYYLKPKKPTRNI
jgi:hypothetical protein